MSSNNNSSNGLVDVNSLTGIFNECCKKPENLINIGYLTECFKTNWQCVVCSRIFQKREPNPQPYRWKSFLQWRDWLGF